MKIKIRTLKQEKYEFDITDETTVADLNKMIEDKYQHKASWQILIFSGKQLSRENTIKSYNVGENDFLVLMVKKPKEEEEAKPKPATPAATPATATPSSAPSTQQANAPSTPSVSAPAPTPGTGAPASATPAPLVDPITGQNIQSMIDQLSDMGFPKDQAALALRASFYNMDRAVEYLTNGIPQGAIPAVATGTAAAPTPAQPATGSPAPARQPAAPANRQPVLPGNLIPPGLAQGQGNPLEALRNNPMLPLLQQIAREDPNRLTEFLASIAQTHPELLRAIVAHREEFIRLLSGGAVPGGAPGGLGAGLGGAAAPQHTISVTPEDQEKIQNIIAITGMSRERVMEAYFLFEKDEQEAINYLFNNPGDEYD